MLHLCIYNQEIICCRMFLFMLLDGYQLCIHSTYANGAGGEFFSHLRKACRFPNDTARFYTAGVVLTFEYLHNRNIVSALSL